MATFTEYLPDPVELAAAVERVSNNLRINKGEVEILPFALAVIDKRLQKDPMRYLDYGPYWWALKGALNRGGYEYGSDTDEEIANVYCGANDAETVVAADGFADFYLSAMFVGTREHQLRDDGSVWTLFDSDMEMGAAA